MRRSLLAAAAAVAIVGAASLSGVAAVPGSLASPNTPADFSTNTVEMCELDTLLFTNGLSIIGSFQPNKFHYQCSCSANFEGSTRAILHLKDNGSSAEVTFNGVKKNFRSTNNALSNGGNDGAAPYSPLKAMEGSAQMDFVPGQNTIMIGVGCNGLGSPETCYYQYTVTCDKPSFIVGDPQFVGLRGQSYQVHGVSGEVYNIVSDADLQYNSKFVFLDSGACPVVNGKKQKGCFSHPGSYLGEIGIKTRAGDQIHLETGDAKQGFAGVSVNGKALTIGETVILAGDMGSVSLNNTHLASVQVGNWDFAFENSDRFVNQRVRVLDARQLRSHGLLGQTWRETTYANAVKYIAGQVDDYVIRDGDIFGDNFVYNTFN